ncbi:elongation factor P hydroxylase [Alcanivorax sp. JB21]|uniref:elongation factor P hydroxylase n=1 Tax=Alcanivorax limicola TaxID=2874102 RepID=UPI001CBD2021|nr:elongation factor P hydroxylase [Alcanivorax limicola]MBZ2187511.1 elongation factor P hydroxylase [Alcanivorax limicola]
MRVANLTHYTNAGEADQPVEPVHRAQDLEALFAQTFAAHYNTVLCGGAEEPLYQPGAPHRIVYTRDYFRSALHEVAHWCVAGEKRRQLPDYGYWYAPDGRDAVQQQAFEQVEVRPQALELLFCEACGHPFSVSLDNLEGLSGVLGEAASRNDAFARAVASQAEVFRAQAREQRWARWVRVLRAHYTLGR